MIEILTRWWFARKVCRKYNITFEVLLSGDYGSFWCINTGSENPTYKIQTSIRSSNFYEIFFHELGHIIDYRRTHGCSSGRYYRYKGARVAGTSFTGDLRQPYKYDKMFTKDYASTVVMEAVASKYAIRYLKSCGKVKPTSRGYLFDAFCTYYQQVDNVHFADGYLMFRKYFGLEGN